MNKETKECYICLDTIIEIRKPLFCGCNNNYYDDCLTKWLVNNNNNKCPICGVIIVNNGFTENVVDIIYILENDLNISPYN
jgi:hypothetical protein